MVGDNKDSLKGKGVFFGASVGGWWFFGGFGGGLLSFLLEWACLAVGRRGRARGLPGIEFGFAPSIRAFALLREGWREGVLGLGWLEVAWD